nr:GNAT family N-acetyltransferase [Anaerolineae bacterium]
MLLPTVKTATASDENQTTAVILLAFSADPIERWLYPDPHQYLVNFPKLVSAFSGKAFEYGSVYYLDGYSGAALWLPPDVHLDEVAVIGALESTVAERDQGEVMAVLEQMSRYHPLEPHWYLQLMGVDPTHHNKGYGSKLLKHTLVSCDREKIPAYLESSNPKNIPFYERHGFELLGTIQVGNSPPM